MILLQDIIKRFEQSKDQHYQGRVGQNFEQNTEIKKNIENENVGYEKIGDEQVGHDQFLVSIF